VCHPGTLGTVVTLRRDKLLEQALSIYSILSSSYSTVPTVPPVPKACIPRASAGTVVGRLVRQECGKGADAEPPAPCSWPILRAYELPGNGRAFALIASEPSVASCIGRW